MELNIQSAKVRSTEAKADIGWSVWKKPARFFSGGQFGVAELKVPQQPEGDAVDDLAAEIRAAAKIEFGGRWYRGAGWGTVLRFRRAAKDLIPLFDQIDLRNRLDGNIWQWIVMVFEEDQAAVGMHMWYHGYLHPVFLEVAARFEGGGYDVVVTDTKVDPLVQKLEKMHSALDPFKWLDALVR